MKRFAVIFLALFSFMVAPAIPGLRSPVQAVHAEVVDPAPATHDQDIGTILQILAQQEQKPALVRPDLAPGEHWAPVIKLTEEVSGDSVHRVQALIDSANEQGAEAIILEINTPGGSVGDGFDLARTMEDSKAPIACVVDGMAASMGYYLLQSCQTRLMTKRSVLMVHEPAVYGEFGGQQSRAKNLTEMLHAMSEAMLYQESYRLNVSFDYVKAKTLNGQEWWLNWGEADQVKAVDGVVKSVKEVAQSYKKNLRPPRHKVK